MTSITSQHSNGYYDRVQTTTDGPLGGPTGCGDRTGEGVAQSDAIMQKKKLAILSDLHGYLSAASPTHHSTSQLHALLYSSHWGQNRGGSVAYHHLRHQGYLHLHQVIRHFLVSYELEESASVSVQVFDSEEGIEDPRQKFG